MNETVSNEIDKALYQLAYGESRPPSRAAFIKAYSVECRAYLLDNALVNVGNRITLTPKGSDLANQMFS